jgi:hypothetical protein
MRLSIIFGTSWLLGFFVVTCFFSDGVVILVWLTFKGSVSNLDMNIMLISYLYKNLLPFCFLSVDFVPGIFCLTEVFIIDRIN